MLPKDIMFLFLNICRKALQQIHLRKEPGVLTLRKGIGRLWGPLCAALDFETVSDLYQITYDIHYPK